MRAALASVDASRVKAIGVSGQQHGLVAMDASGCVLRPAKLWCDTESAPEARELSEKLRFPLVRACTGAARCWQPTTAGRRPCAPPASPTHHQHLLRP